MNEHDLKYTNIQLLNTFIHIYMYITKKCIQRFKIHL